MGRGLPFFRKSRLAGRTKRRKTTTIAAVASSIILQPKAWMRDSFPVFDHSDRTVKYLHVVVDVRPAGHELRLPEEPQEDHQNEEDENAGLVIRHRSQVLVFAAD